jgi:hypothetical protein
LTAVYLSRAFPRSTGLLCLPFKGPGDVIKSPASGLRDFEEGEDQEDDKESSKDDEDVGS